MVKQALKRLLATSWGWKAGALVRRTGVIVLMYHRITRGKEPFPGLDLARFRAQMQWIKRHGLVIAPEELLDYARAGRRTRPPVLVTFDDGYRDYYDNAYPILDELRIPVVAFLATAFLDHGGMIWTDTVHWAAGTARVPVARLPWDLRVTFDLRQPAQRSAFVGRCKADLKEAPDADRRRWLAALLTELGVAGREEEAGRQMLTWDEVRATAPLTRYGGHTHTHPIMSRLGPVELEREVGLCRERIAKETGVAPRYFAYPNGGPDDFTDDCKAVLRRHGFDLAFTTIEGPNEGQADPMALRRTPTGAATLGDFVWLAGGR